MRICQACSGVHEERLGQSRSALADLALDEELAAGIDDGRVPYRLFLAPDESVAFVRLNARDLQVTSIQVVEVSRVGSGNADDARDRGAVTADQMARGDEAVAVGDMFDDGINGVLGAAGIPVGRAFEFTEFRTAHGALEESSAVRAVSSAELDGAALRVVLGWTGGVLTDETLEWELF
ncbi:hypothetical protein DEIGR_330038 [Deinococcus grandis]|uniref:Uncharacterized protein n=1 Tax=Deinococcus grandis TaxID=57498 RepID=A0A100HQC6_9DEIO|nr:hypothetical protein DEIGR_330038 [Deinococcus grandis]